MVQALGGSPTPIAWGELYSALQQGVVDGAENNPPSFHLSRHYEVCRHYSLDEHTGVPDVLLISTKLWQDLPHEFRVLIQEAALESAQVQKELWAEATERALAEVRAAGVQIHYPDKSLFEARIGSLYDEYRDQPAVFNLIRAIREVE
jgi:TRAP-type C4-dicarboxylate transport system substrate-binding protein